MNNLIFAAALLTLCSCQAVVGALGLVTPADLREVAQVQEDYQDVLDDQDSSVGDIESAMAEYGARLDGVADRVEQRAETFVEGIANPSNWGPGGIAAAAMYLLRNQQRRRRGEPVTRAEARSQRPPPYAPPGPPPQQPPSS